jgi:hypothetical protein
MDAHTLRELWDDYGIVGGLIVRSSLFHRRKVSYSLRVCPAVYSSFSRANIHELLTPDLLHQIIKGAFKDHLVDWIIQYINSLHPKAEAERIVDDIDKRYVYFLHPRDKYLKRTIED